MRLWSLIKLWFKKYECTIPDYRLTIMFSYVVIINYYYKLLHSVCFPYLVNDDVSSLFMDKEHTINSHYCNPLYSNTIDTSFLYCCHARKNLSSVPVCAGIIPASSTVLMQEHKYIVPKSPPSDQSSCIPHGQQP